MTGLQIAQNGILVIDHSEKGARFYDSSGHKHVERKASTNR